MGYHQRSRDIADKVAAHIPLHGVHTLLDLEGPGTYALAFLKRNPKIIATVCDRQEALDVAKKLAGTTKVGKRRSYLTADFMTKSIPGRYDIVWYSHT